MSLAIVLRFCSIFVRYVHGVVFVIFFHWHIVFIFIFITWSFNTSAVGLLCRFPSGFGRRSVEYRLLQLCRRRRLRYWCILVCTIKLSDCQRFALSIAYFLLRLSANTPKLNKEQHFSLHTIITICFPKNSKPCKARIAWVLAWISRKTICA